MFIWAKETSVPNMLFYHPDPNKPWIIETNTSKTVYARVLLQCYTKDRITQEVPMMFLLYNFTGIQQAWGATERELSAFFVTMGKLSYHIKGGQVIIKTDHKPLVEICSGMTKNNTAAVEKLSLDL